MAGALLLATGVAAAQQPTAQSLAATVDAHYNHLHSLQARYTERYVGPGVDRSEAGTLLLLKPGRMRWTYDAPAGKLFLVDGNTAISYTPGDATATRIPAKQIDDFRSPLGLLLGHTHIAHELTNLSVAPQTPGTYTLTGTPRGAMARLLKQVQLTVTGTGELQQLRLLQADGSTIQFVFTNAKENLPVSDANFQFTPPPGVTFINGPAAE